MLENEKDATYAVSPSVGTITVTASPLVIRKIENLIKNQNEIISRQVIIDVNVMTIVTDKSENFQMDFNSVLNGLTDEFGLSWSGPTGELTQLTDGISGVLEGSFASLNGKKSANLLLDALSQKFDTSVTTNATVTTLNNHTVPLQIITRESYLKELETTISETSVSTAATPGDITTGFVMNLLPRILSGGNVMLQYSMSLSEKTGLETINFGEDANSDGVGDSLIQLPTVVSRDFLQNIKLTSGNTLVLAGYDRVLNSSEQAGTGNEKFWYLGGGKYSEKRKEVLVIMITPRIIK
jgi:type IVB pilus formation R64 PilN family outer membrane protein